MNKLNKINDFLKTPGLHTSSVEAMINELNTREKEPNPFPLEVFSEEVKPYLNALVENFENPKCYIGLSLLAAYSTCIGNAYQVSLNRRNHLPLTIWACMEGLSSSGKSIAIDLIHEPLFKIQKQFDREWDIIKQGLTKEKLNNEILKTIVFRDSHVPTLIRSVLPDNPKGVIKHSDEILEWLHGMNQLAKKEGTDQEFWLSTWNGRSYSGIRSGKDKFTIPRPFVNIIGGIQPSITYKLFAKDRDTSGFIFRLLFAVPQSNDVTIFNPYFRMDENLEKIHSDSLMSLYKDLPVTDPYKEPKKCFLDDSATKVFHKWQIDRRNHINSIEDVFEKEIHAGIFGKIGEYILRFSALLQLADKSYGNKEYYPIETIDVGVIKRAIRLGEYFYKSALEVYERVNSNTTAPVEVVQVAGLIRMGKDFTYISKNFYNGKIHRSTVSRKVKQWIIQYPRVFGALPN